MSSPYIGPLIRELTLPKPHSLNAFRNNYNHRTRGYKRWQAKACGEIMAQGPRRLIDGPVFIDLRFPASVCSPQCDTDNQAKCILDALVSMGILSDDNRKIVPVLLLRWGPGDQTRVRIYEFLGDVL